MKNTLSLFVNSSSYLLIFQDLLETKSIKNICTDWNPLAPTKTLRGVKDNPTYQVDDLSIGQPGKVPF